MSPGPGMMPEERREVHLFRQCPDQHPQKTDRQVPDGGMFWGPNPFRTGERSSTKTASRHHWSRL
ncbi:MAG: hypothetical protein ACYDBP_15405 [Leptospirales bacterium]